MGFKEYNRSSLSFSIIILSIVLSILGISLAGLLPVKLSPDRSAMKLEISFTTGDISPWYTETSVTSKIESICARIKGINEIKSKSERGKGTIILTLDKDSDADKVRFEVSVAMRQIWTQLPEGTSYPQVRIINSEGITSRPFMILGISAACSTDTIEAVANDVIVPEIGSIDGVYSCVLTGSAQNIWEIEYESETLNNLRLSRSHIEKSLRNDFLIHNLSINNIDGKRKRVMIEPYPTHKGAFSPSNSWIGLNGDSTFISGSRIFHSQLKEASSNEIFRINGRSMVYCLIIPEISANQLQLSAEIEEVIANCQQRFPQGYHISKISDSTERISSELKTLYSRTALTILILLIFIAITSKSLKYTLLISISLVFNIAIVFILYYVLKIEIQLYTLAAITISLNIVMDNIIVMTEHMIRKYDRSVFTSILAASLTTIGALSIVFFMEEDLRITLEHFVIVVIVNLVVSLLIALFVVPALIDKLKIRQRTYNADETIHNGCFTYEKLIEKLQSHKVLFFFILIIIFGTPIFLLPKKLDKDTRFSDLYNSTIGSDFYTYRVRPFVDICTGGTLRLFVENVYKGEYRDNAAEEPVLTVLLNMPAEVDISMTDETIRTLENHISSLAGIRQVRASIYPQKGVVEVFFTKEGITDGLPAIIKDEVWSYVQTLGAGTWYVSGVNDDNYTNSTRQLSGEIRVRLTGYDYSVLERLMTQLQDSISRHRRFQVPTISAEPTKWKEVKQEYHYTFDREKLTHYNISGNDVLEAMNATNTENTVVGEINNNNVVLKSSDSTVPTEWELTNQPIIIAGSTVKLAHLGAFSIKSTPSEIIKKNQEYQLYLQVGYIGDETNGTKIIDEIIDNLRNDLPMGFSIERELTPSFFSFTSSYWLLLVAIVIIFFITTILFGNIWQSVAIILTIPISYIGLFIAFYLAGAKLDQGALAAFVLLSGLIVNIAIYLIDTMNELSLTNPETSKINQFVNAWYIKRKSIFLTIASTILGFLPFIIGISHESFWYTLALGTIGGLTIGIIGITLYLPLFLIKHKQQ